jgi:hypothetical protein
LTSPPTIDGQEWIKAPVHHGPAPDTVRAGDRQFSLILSEPGVDTGDLARFELRLQRGAAAPVRIDNEFTAWAYVTPDRRYIFTEPLYVLDVREWKQYELFDALGIQNYVSIDAISRDGGRLLISRTDCAFDCTGNRSEYFELTLPATR